MNGAVGKAMLFVLMIGIGYLFKALRILKKEDSNVLASLIVNLTLPCVFFSSAVGLKLDFLSLGLVLMGFFSNLALIILALVLTRGQTWLMRGVYMISCSGYDIGNFVLPFISAFFAGAGVLYLCTYNVANIIMSMGLTYAFAAACMGQKGNFSFREFFRRLFTSVSFDVYLLVVVLALLNIEVPAPVVNVTSSIAGANTFLAMTMIGLRLELRVSRQDVWHLVRIIGIRLAGAVLLSVVTWCLPLPALARNVLIISYFGPLISVSSIYTRRLGYEGNVVANANSVSILIGLAAMTGLIMFLPGT